MRSQNYDSVSAGARIRRARETKKLTQDSVSEKVGVGVQHISNIERGCVKISIDTLTKLCGVLEVSADYVLFGKEATSAVSPLYNLIADLADKDKLIVEKIVEIFISRER